LINADNADAIDQLELELESN